MLSFAHYARDARCARLRAHESCTRVTGTLVGRGEHTRAKPEQSAAKLCRPPGRSQVAHESLSNVALSGKCVRYKFTSDRARF